MDKTHQVIEIVLAILENKGAKKEHKSIANESHLRNDLGLDSFDLAELTVRIEDRFGVDIFSDGIVNTVEEVVAKLG